MLELLLLLIKNLIANINVGNYRFYEAIIQSIEHKIMFKRICFIEAQSMKAQRLMGFSMKLQKRTTNHCG